MLYYKVMTTINKKTKIDTVVEVVDVNNLKKVKDTTIKEFVNQKKVSEAGDCAVYTNSKGQQTYLVVVNNKKEARKIRNAGAHSCAWAIGVKAKNVKFIGDVTEGFVEGFLNRNYLFTKYKTDKKQPKNIEGIETDVKVSKETLNCVSGSHLARDLMNEPSNVLYPEAYAKRVQKIFSGISGVSIKVLGEKELKKLNMNLMLAVGQGSRKESKMVVMEYKGGSGKGYDMALVGKGVTFDTGGISIKPGIGMEGMKLDMGGSATVVGSLYTIAKNKTKKNVVGLIGLVENMPDGDATNPGDIITAASGKTVEIINTDAEGRLVLADVLHYAQEKYKPKNMLDFATLTGAIVVALGAEYAGVFSNDEKLSEKIIEASKQTNEEAWVMPIHENYLKRMSTSVADLRNLSVVAMDSGAGTAAAFLKEFVKPSTKWAHFDIAGSSFPSSYNAYTGGKEPCGWGVAMIQELIKKL